MWPNLEGKKDFNDDHKERLSTLSSRSQYLKNVMKMLKPRWHAMHKTRFQMLTNDKIMTYAQKESTPVDDETDGDKNSNNNESSKDPSNADVFSTLKTAIERLLKEFSEEYIIMTNNHSIHLNPSTVVNEIRPTAHHKMTDSFLWNRD
ncbi:hypothetical protein TNCV_1965821 [Trichonephila clavipes]|nr:hypothetical protein TNCV_1965821 [Trichonephila clavipes]